MKGVKSSSFIVYAYYRPFERIGILEIFSMKNIWIKHSITLSCALFGFRLESL